MTRSSARSFVVALLCAPLFACGSGHAHAGLSASAVDQGSSGDDFELQIEFGSYAFLGSTMAGGQEIGAIPAGSHVEISYVKGYTSVGLSAAPATLEVDWSVNGGSAQSVSATNEFSTADGRIGISSGLDVPATATGQLAIWFKFTSADGTAFYDSLGGQNYIANILPSSDAVITFGAPQGGTWPGPSVQGSLSAGAAFRISYDFARVTALGLNAQDAFVEAYANSLDANGQLISVSQANVPNGGLSTSLDIAQGAAQVQVYFAEESDEETAYDSNVGQNFSFGLH